MPHSCPCVLCRDRVGILTFDFFIHFVLARQTEIYAMGSLVEREKGICRPARAMHHKQGIRVQAFDSRGLTERSYCVKELV
jgi:hypothetical protein